MATPIERSRTVTGEVIPMVSASRLPAAPLGIPALARLRNWSDTKQFESYTELEEAINRHLNALGRQVELHGNLTQRRAYWNGRLSELDGIRDSAAAEVRAETAEATSTARIRALTQDITITNLELELKVARAALDAPSHATQAPATRGGTNELTILFDDVRAMEAAFDEHVATIIRVGGGEENLSEEVREHIDNVRMLKTDKLQSLYEKMR